MKEVKIVIAHERYDEYESSSYILQEGISDWEQLSDDEYKLLKDNWYRIVQDVQQKRYGVIPILVEKDSSPISLRIASIKTWVNEEKERAAKDAADRKAKAEERAKKKMLKAAKSELALLEELKKKYPNNV